MKICASCKRSFPDEKKFCNYCGEPLPPADEKVIPGLPQPESHIESIVEESYTRPCPSCGQPITNPSAKFCKHCGTRLDATNTSGIPLFKSTGYGQAESVSPFLLILSIIVIVVAAGLGSFWLYQNFAGPGSESDQPVETASTDETSQGRQIKAPSQSEITNESAVVTVEESGRSQTDAPTSEPRGEEKVIPQGTLLEVRLAEALSSGFNQPGDKFEAILDSDLMSDDQIVIPQGSRVYGKILKVADGANRYEAMMSLTFIEILVGDRVYGINGSEMIFSGPKSSVRGQAEQIEFPSNHKFSFRLDEDLAIELP